VARLGPVKRRDFIARLRVLGFDGPTPGGNHEFMTRGDLTIRVPNPHGSGDIDGELLGRILRNAGIRDEWDA